MGNFRSKQYAECPHCETAYNPSTVQNDTCLNCGGSLSTPGLPVDNDPSFDAPDYKVSPSQLEAMPVPHSKTMSVNSSLFKKGYGLTNQGEENSVCPKCQQPIAEGQMVNYPAGKETHVQCPPPQAQQPGQQAPGWQSRLNLPPGYQPKQQPAQAKIPGNIPPSVGAPRAGSLLEKKADERFIDDEWRAILEHYGFRPDFGSGIEGDVWSHDGFGIKIAINTDDKGEAYWVAMQENGTPLESGQDTHRLETQLASIQETAEPKEEIAWKDDVPEFSDADKDFMKDFRIVGRARKGKTGARKPNFGFAVPLKSAGAVAFHLAKAGMKDFEVIHYEDDDSSVFAFTNEPSMHLGEEIVRAEFADQIGSRKGMWGSWSPSAKAMEDPSLVKSEQELHTPMASDKTAGLSVADRQRLEDHVARMTIAGQYKDKHQLAKEIINHIEEAMRGEHGFDSGNDQKFLRGKKFGPQLVESDKTSADSPSSPQYPDVEETENEKRDRMIEEEEGRQDRELHEETQVATYEDALNRALTSLEVLANIGPSEDIRACASASAGDLKSFADDYAAGNARHFSAYSSGDSVYCCVLGHVQRKAGFEKRALDANLVTLIGSFVGSVLVKWLGQEYSKRWGAVAKAAESKAIAALQKQGVYDLGTLDKYAQENGTSQIGAFMRLCGQSMLLAVAMTTGIAGAKILNGDAKTAPAVTQSQTPSQNQMTLTDEVVAPAPQAPAPKPHRPSKEQLKQQQQQRDQQVMEQIRQQDKDRNPQNIV